MREYVTSDGRRFLILEEAEDVNAEVLQIAEETVDFFDDQPRMPTEEFLDRMFERRD